MIIPTTTRNAIVDLITSLLDSGSYIEFQTSGGVVVATLTFSDPAFFAAVSGTATADSITSDTNAVGGTIAKAVIKDSSDATILTLTAGLTGTGADIEAASLVVAPAETVTIASMTLTQPAS